MKTQVTKNYKKQTRISTDMINIQDDSYQVNKFEPSLSEIDSEGIKMVPKVTSMSNENLVEKF